MNAEKHERINRAREKVLELLTPEIPGEMLAAIMAEIHEIQFSAWDNGWDAGRDSALERGRALAFSEGHNAGFNAALRSFDARRAAEEMPIKPME